MPRCAMILLTLSAFLSNRMMASCQGPTPALAPQNVALTWSDAGGTCNETNPTCAVGASLTFKVIDFPPGTISPCGLYSFSWDAGDGTKLITATPQFQHVYSSAGHYHVSVSIQQSPYANNPIVLAEDLTVAYSTPFLTTAAYAILLFLILVIAVLRIT